MEWFEPESYCPSWRRTGPPSTASCSHDDRGDVVRWPSSEAGAAFFAIPLAVFVPVAVVAWLNTFVNQTDWSGFTVPMALWQGVVAVISACLTGLFALVAALLMHRLVIAPRKFEVHPDRVVLIGPLGIRYPWHRLKRPVQATVIPETGRQLGFFSVVVQAEGRRPITVACGLGNHDARFLAAHLQ